MRTIFYTITLILLSFDYSTANQEYSFLIHLNDKNIEFKKRIPEFHVTIPKKLNVFPNDIYTSIIYSKKLYVLTVDPQKSDTSGLFYLVEENNQLKALDYIYDTLGDTVTDIILFDIDKDSTDEIISIWQDEESYRVRVDKFDKHFKRMNVFNSSRKFIPTFQGYKHKMVINGDALYLIYSYQNLDGVVNKKAILTINPDDQSKELFLKPLGTIDKSQWFSIQKER